MRNYWKILSMGPLLSQWVKTQNFLTVFGDHAIFSTSSGFGEARRQNFSKENFARKYLKWLIHSQHEKLEADGMIEILKIFSTYLKNYRKYEWAICFSWQRMRDWYFGQSQLLVFLYQEERYDLVFDAFLDLLLTVNLFFSVNDSDTCQSVLVLLLNLELV